MPLTLARRAVAISSLALAGLVGSGCGTTYAVGSYDRNDVREALENDAGLVLGEFPLKQKGVVDGDTIKVGGLGASLRLLGMDTEETFKSEKDRRGYEKGWEWYLQWKASKTSRPIKVATPLGEDAKKFAKQWFKGVNVVRLERDHPKEIKGRFNRFLTYVFAEKNGEWVNYNVEAVRAGMSPYFTKYGYSRRFHDEFVEAQKQAQAARVGIWDPSKEHYRDYPERLAWWEARAKFFQKYERMADARDDVIVLTQWDSMRRLKEREGQPTTIISTVGDVRLGDKGPTRVMLSRRMFSDVPAVFFDRFAFEDSKIAEWKGEPVAVRGKVNTWVNPHNGRETVQLIVNLASQVFTPTYTPPGNGAEKVAPAAEAQAEKARQPSAAEPRSDPGSAEPQADEAPAEEPAQE